jgi:hypothetical protein
VTDQLTTPKVEEDSIPARLERAHRLALKRQFEATLAILAPLLEETPSRIPHKQRAGVFESALKCAIRVGRWDQAEALARLAIAAGHAVAAAHEYLGEALVQLQRLDEAEAALEQAVRLDSKREGARSLLAILRKGVLKAPPKRLRIWPGRATKFSQPEKLIRRYMLADRPPDRFITPQSTFMTLGSCFATNLALRLRAAGHTVHCENIGEAVNSTFANRYLLQWIEQGVVDGPTALMDEVYGPELRERFRASIAASDVFVMTLGVAACFFDDVTGEFAFASMERKANTDVLFERRTMRTTTVAENVENIRWIIAAMRRMARRPPKIVLTLSPVPLTATTELESAFVADCVSKSTLRVACHEVVTSEGEDVIYWPSFEIVRWAGPHFGPESPRIWSAEDDNSRHVSNWLVDLIISLFLDHHSVSSAPEAAAVER